MVAQSGFTHNSQLQELINRGRQLAANRKRQDELDAEERRSEECHRRLDRIAGTGAPEWMYDYMSAHNYQDEWRFEVSLPDCAPFTFRSMRFIDGTYSYSDVRVLEAQNVWFDLDAEVWHVKYQPVGLHSMPALDEAIALAADLGESWHAMSTEAARRNAEGLRPEPPTEQTPQPERVTLPALYRRAYQCAEDCETIEGDGVISALLAIAAEIRSLRVALTGSQVQL